MPEPRTDATQNPPPPGTAPSSQATPPAPSAKPPVDPPAKPPGTIYEAAGLPEPPTQFPENWREQLAAGDEKKLERLKRYQSPSAVVDALAGIQQRISTGEYKRAKPPEDAKPEEIAAWRAEHGLPVKVEDFPLPLAEGVKLEELPEHERANVKAIQETFFKADMTPAQATQVLATYNSMVEAQQEAMADADAQAQDALEDKLRADWGADYKGNIALNERFIKTEFGSPELANGILLARLPDDKSLGEFAGRRLVDLPIFNAFLNKMARTTTTGDVLETGEASLQGVESRIEELRKIMATDIRRYRREGLDKEYERLLAVQDKRGKPAAAAQAS